MDGGWGPPRRAEDGTPVCRWCGGTLPGRRRTFCSDACVEEWKVRSDPSYARARVRERDRGRCARCGRDTAADAAELVALRGQYSSARQAGDRERSGSAEHRARQLHELYGLRWDEWWWVDRSRPHVWEAHHTTAVAEGGGECGLEGFETLCLPCHRRETAALAGRLADARRGPHAKLIAIPGTEEDGA